MIMNAHVHYIPWEYFVRGITYRMFTANANIRRKKRLIRCHVIRQAFFFIIAWFYSDSICLFKFVWFGEAKKNVSQTFHLKYEKKNWWRKRMKRMWLLFVCTNICISKKLFAVAKITDWLSEMYILAYQFHLLLSWLTNP